METRILTNISDTLADISTVSNDYYAGTGAITLTTTDYIYIGQRHPFNHLYFKFGTANTEALTLGVKIWDGSDWNAVAEVIDETEGLTQDGFLTWHPDKYETWVCDDTVDSQGNECVTGLGDMKIYDRYWIRLSISANMSASSTLAWIGNLFSNDNDLKSQYSELGLSAYKTAWEAGKSSWQEQHMIAAKRIIDDLIRKNVVNFKGQVLDREKFTLASVHATAEIIFNGLGDDYEDNRSKAMAKYMKAANKGIFNVDKDKDGRIDKVETRVRQGSISR